VKDGERPAETRFEWSAFGAFRTWPVIAVGLAGLLVFLVIVGANQLINPFLQEELGISLSQAGMVTSLWGLGVVGGSFVGGWLMSKTKHKVATLIMLAMVAVTLLGVGFLTKASLGLAFAILLVILFGVAYGAAQTITFALCMKVVDPRIAASMFAILMAFTNIGQGIGLGLGGGLSDGIGFRLTFAVFAGLLLLVLPFLSGVFKRDKAVKA